MGNGLERRAFLKVLGVSGAGAAATACGGTGTAEKLIPYVVPHEEIVPGVSTWYRTTCMECPAGCGMSIRTREGRAVKAEGNPLSPISHGKLCARGQASLHGLYNPDRIPQALARGAPDQSAEPWTRLTWDEAEQRLADALAQNRGRTVFLTESMTGTMDRLIDEFCAVFGIERVRFEPFGLEPIRAAHRLLFGVDAVPAHDFANADVVISFGADFIETWLSPVDYAHGFVQAHALAGERKGRLVSVAPHQSLTDMNADDWLPIRPGTEHLVALAIARIIADNGGNAGGAAGLLGTVDVTQNAHAAGVSPERLRQVAVAFANGGRSLAVGPGVSSMHGSATAVAAAVAVLNQVAGNIGTTVRFETRERAGATGGSYADMKALAGRMQAGQIGALLVHGPNPVYALPDADAVAQAMGQVGFVASFSPYLDETSSLAHLLLPDHHFLESWGDTEPRTGTHALVQPVMTPVFPTRQTGDVLLSVAQRAGVTLPSQATTFYDYLRERWLRDVHPLAGGGAPFDLWWRETLQTGFVTIEAPPALAPAINPAGLAQIQFTEPSFEGDPANPVLVLYPSSRFYDGRLANRPWLQELPDPISKYTWGSWIEVGPETAREMGLDTGHVLEVTTPAGSAQLPVWAHPGMRNDVIAIQLGQGHTALGVYAQNRGVNGVKLINGVTEAVSGALVYQQVRASIRATGEWRRPAQAGLVNDQDGREIAQHLDLDEAREAEASRHVAMLGGTGATRAPAAEAEHVEEGAQAAAHDVEVHPNDARVAQLHGAGGFRPVDVDASPTGFPPPDTHYGEYSEQHPRWGMSIDLERCTGCSACITACYAENNIGIVGPELVSNGRILHWIRIERYFEGEGEDLHTAFLPMMCQQCGNAPCEPVCPVYASYHTPDGLNAQVYNRCVGTRYCANNCPYKVRVYNWFSWEWPEPLNWQLNPDVTVREKGVMEKCTFCVQRIREAENNARLADRRVTDGEITPACAQTCPGDAIVFGNLKDPNSRVARLASSGRGYRVLEHLNTQSAVVYLRKVVAGVAEG
ncbi:MAG: 4Fe-4S dicluster domain-containing protein [Gemmatimonadetes bacterium]|nr:4Fe-4S dicluster domain-containing protein [Gemmatimonadota bacterium]